MVFFVKKIVPNISSLRKTGSIFTTYGTGLSRLNLYILVLKLKDIWLVSQYYFSEHKKKRKKKIKL
jgi:hypothetical protein